MEPTAPREIFTKEATKQTHTLSGVTNTGSYEYFHTFAGLSTNKKETLKTPEQFIDDVLEIVSNEPEDYVSWNHLLQLVLQKCPKFEDSFRQYLYPSEEEQFVLISNVGRLLEDLMSEQISEPLENEVRTICRLLDIEQKGYITEQDIEDFLRQLEDSEAEDIDTISQYLWRYIAG